ncbi:MULTISPECIES: Gfo/Idh/MocA family protein [Bacillus]|uniref:Gfo/Idh/MocA family protein n=1 Tax=Bacillus TaxID=1386 RepID=UPI001F5994B8|nr:MULTISPECIES: Gfo/Idh/MocA family oxidoreductase [Bacillus cereus group]USL15374.1 Gfo/Idh/MocA family oxidoreductase [Bacillus thuringiensis]
MNLLTKENVNIALIGCGRHLTRSLLPNIVAHPKTSVVAAADIIPERLEAISKRIKGIKTFKSAEDLLEQATELSIDAVVISMDPAGHLKFAEKAIQKDLHVFVEKPAAFFEEDLRKIGIEAERKNLATCVGSKWRYTPGTKVLKDWINIDSVERDPDLILLDVTFPKGLTDELWGLNGVQAAFYDIYIHAIDYIFSWLGNISDIKTDLIKFEKNKQKVVITCKNSDGKTAIASLVRGSAAYQVNFTAHLNDGTQAILKDLTHLEITPVRPWSNTEGSFRDHPSLQWNPGRLYRGYARAGYAEEWDSFIESILSNTTTPTNLIMASSVLGVIERCLHQIGHPLNKNKVGR